MENQIPLDWIMQTQRILPYTPDEVYAAFADPTRLAKWWGPNGFTNTFEIFEFKKWGNWEFVMHGPDGHDYPNKSVFQSIEPGKKIIIEHVCQPYFTLTVSLLSDATGTRIVWAQAFEDLNVLTAIRHIVEPSNEQNLDRLHMHLRGE